MIDDYFFYYSFMFLGNRSSSSGGFQKQINIPPAVNLQSDAPQDDHVDRRAYVKSSENQNDACYWTWSRNSKSINDEG